MTPAIVLCNMVYLERATAALRGRAHLVDDALLQYLSPLGSEHLNLVGDDHLWLNRAKVESASSSPPPSGPPYDFFRNL